jgi:hypothetical protein
MIHHEYPCEHGHFDCSDRERGPCSDEHREPEDNDDEVAREIAEHERAIFDNPDPAYGP